MSFRKSFELIFAFKLFVLGMNVGLARHAVSDAFLTFYLNLKARVSLPSFFLRFLRRVCNVGSQNALLDISVHF